MDVVFTETISIPNNNEKIHYSFLLIAMMGVNFILKTLKTVNIIINVIW